MGGGKEHKDKGLLSHPVGVGHHYQEQYGEGEGTLRRAIRQQLEPTLRRAIHHKVTPPLDSQVHTTQLLFLPSICFD